MLEFVPGGSLKERLSGPVPPRAAAELMRPVAAAMTAVHAAGLLHLDLKPSNILLDSAQDATWKDASPKVADFGIARPLADLDASSTSLAGPWGTPSYMAPEQATAVRAGLGPATDVYALGTILYELLTGRPPFQGASTLETLDQVRSQKPVPPRRLNPSSRATWKPSLSNAWRKTRAPLRLGRGPGRRPRTASWKAVRSRRGPFPRSSTPGAGAAASL